MQTVALFIEEFYCVLNVEIVPDHARNCDYIFVVIFQRISSSSTYVHSGSTVVNDLGI